MTSILLQEFILILILGVFLSGVVATLVRRSAVWSLIGQIIALKAVIAGCFFWAISIGRSSGDLLMLCLIFLGIMPSVAAIGLLVLHRCSRFEGTLDYEEEDKLRN